jgi:glycosyltransferase involved in cell wall biosynthesis
MKIVLSHPTGNQFVRALIASLIKDNILLEFNTTLVFDAQKNWIKFIPSSMQKDLLRRSYKIPINQIHTHPAKEIIRLFLSRLGFYNLINSEKSWVGIDAVYKDFDRHVANRLDILMKTISLNGVYSYEDCAMTTFRYAKSRNLRCIYDLPIAYFETCRKLLLEESERLPNWSRTLGGGVKDSEYKLNCKKREIEMADTIVIPSKFVKDSLPEWVKEKQIILAPFGSPEISNNSQFLIDKQKYKHPMRILFVGSMSQRKGLADLFNAFKLLDCSNIELVVLGQPQVSMNFYRKEYPNFRFESTRPHDKVLELMRSCDIFCLPSIVEGRALVMQEAMSQGLPLIITPNTGGVDLIKEGQTGYIVPIRSPESIADKLNWFIENRSKIPEMGRLAQNLASKYSWENYGNQIVKNISEEQN